MNVRNPKCVHYLSDNDNCTLYYIFCTSDILLYQLHLILFYTTLKEQYILSTENCVLSVAVSVLILHEELVRPYIYDYNSEDICFNIIHPFKTLHVFYLCYIYHVTLISITLC